jgi:hypothetical protein
LPHEYCFDAFGRVRAVVRSNGRRTVFDLGADGKRCPADLPIPAAIAADELAQYLGDPLHENATPKRADVVPLPRDRRRRSACARACSLSPHAGQFDR